MRDGVSLCWDTGIERRHSLLECAAKGQRVEDGEELPGLGRQDAMNRGLWRGGVRAVDADHDRNRMRRVGERAQPRPEKDEAKTAGRPADCDCEHKPGVQLALTTMLSVMPSL